MTKNWKEKRKETFKQNTSKLLTSVPASPNMPKIQRISTIYLSEFNYKSSSCLSWNHLFCGEHQQRYRASRSTCKLACRYFSSCSLALAWDGAHGTSWPNPGKWCIQQGMSHEPWRMGVWSKLSSDLTIKQDWVEATDMMISSNKCFWF